MIAVDVTTAVVADANATTTDVQLQRLDIKTETGADLREEVGACFCGVVAGGGQYQIGVGSRALFFLALVSNCVRYNSA